MSNQLKFVYAAFAGRTTASPAELFRRDNPVLISIRSLPGSVQPLEIYEGRKKSFLLPSDRLILV